MTSGVLGLVTCCSRPEAQKIARALVRAKAAACVNILPSLESHYRWQGRVEKARECLLLIKTTRARTRAVERLVKTTHSYEVPEVIFLKLESGDRGYLQWVKDSVR